MQDALNSASGFYSASWPAQIGRTWFRWRGFSPLPFLLVCWLGTPEVTLSLVQLGLVAAGIFLAEGCRLWAVGYAGSATRTRGDTVPALVHAGPFRHVRNPLYLANTLMYCFCALAFGQSVLPFLGLVYFGAQYAFIVAFEEQTLRREFGVAYTYYCARVSRWLPSFRPSIESSGHRFHLAKALRSERASLIALACIGVLVALKRAGY